jgi:DNA mismatch repair protein MutL
MEIRILPSNIANVIAAGEVVTRPASVVKELMENSVDAGASVVTVVITDSGRTLIQVIDNGCGMSPDEAVLCFERHATSKIATAEDLNNITTFGFRGEALASIAAVAEVTLKTRRDEDEVGCEVEFSDSKHLATNEIATPKGCNFAVRNLFFNVPARRKFLKSDTVEFKHIVEEFTRVCLTRSDIGFNLTHNGKDIFILKPAKSLKYRVLDLLGSNVVGDVVDICAETTVVKVHGFIGTPSAARKTIGNQFFFVNGRFFRSPYLHKAIMKAYEEMIPEGYTPSYFVYLNVDPHTMDVNISPTKTEVKFQDDSVIFQILYACVKETIGKNSFSGSIDFDREGAPDIPVFGKSFDEYHRDNFASPDDFVSHDASYNPFEPQATPPSLPSDSHSGTPDFSKYVEKRDDYGKLFEDKTLPSTQVLILQNKYLVTSAKSGLMVVNIHRAFERILFDKFLKALSRNEHVTQTTLFPVRVDVGVENKTIIDEHAQLLASLGFDISPFGNESIVVNGVPEGYSVEQGKVETMVADLLLVLSEPADELSGLMQSVMAQKLAEIGARNCGRISSSVEAQRIIDTLFASDNAEFTNSGHRIVTIILADDIEKKF